LLVQSHTRSQRLLMSLQLFERCCSTCTDIKSNMITLENLEQDWTRWYAISQSLPLANQYFTLSIFARLPTSTSLQSIYVLPCLDLPRSEGRCSLAYVSQRLSDALGLWLSTPTASKWLDTKPRDVMKKQWKFAVDTETLLALFVHIDANLCDATSWYTGFVLVYTGSYPHPRSPGSTTSLPAAPLLFLLLDPITS
jgi:hypothetical protein